MNGQNLEKDYYSEHRLYKGVKMLKRKQNLQKAQYIPDCSSKRNLWIVN